MSLLTWIVLYFLDVLFFIWLIFWGGAEWLERRIISSFLINIFAVMWSSEQIQMYGYIMLVATTFWFLLGLFVPELRLLSWQY